ncbi:hypothetical protein GF361_01705 [Candidatus Woesearchaeota archaeon]|nr:hypothetical protein [Candidatus Woesearchaeota archaeon]
MSYIILEITPIEELIERTGQIIPGYHSKDKKALRFDSLEDALEFEKDFIDYLINKEIYTENQAFKFPLYRHLPDKEITGRVASKKQETWFIIPNKRYAEVQEYLNSLG